MERNADDMFGATGDQDSTTGGSSRMGRRGRECTAANWNIANAPASPSGTEQATPNADQVKATAQNKLGQAKEKT